jgi:hypothetical protein
MPQMMAANASTMSVFCGYKMRQHVDAQMPVTAARGNGRNQCYPQDQELDQLVSPDEAEAEKYAHHDLANSQKHKRPEEDD